LASLWNNARYLSTSGTCSSQKWEAVNSVIGQKRNKWQRIAPHGVGFAVYFLSASVFDSLAGGSPLGLWSPSVDFAGQTLKTGHFLQPTAMATGQSVMGTPRFVCILYLFMPLGGATLSIVSPDHLFGTPFSGE